ncbi:MAG: hypothetical protein RLZZ450_6319, partial [Pseudomonadota bacterium]
MTVHLLCVQSRPAADRDPRLGLSRSTILLLAFLVLSILLWSHGPAAAQAPDAEAEARTVFEAGRNAYDRGRFDEALTHFERAYHLSGHYKLLFNIGRAAES